MGRRAFVRTGLLQKLLRWRGGEFPWQPAEPFEANAMAFDFADKAAKGGRLSFPRAIQIASQPRLGSVRRNSGADDSPAVVAIPRNRPIPVEPATTSGNTGSVALNDVLMGVALRNIWKIGQAG